MASDKAVRIFLCAFLLTLTVLTFLIGLLTWQAVQIAMHVEGAVEQTSRDVQTLSRSIANMGKELEDVVSRLARMEKNAEQATGLDDAEKALEELADLRKEKHADPQRLPPEAKEEVDFLFARIRATDAEFIGGDDRRSPTRFAIHLWVKYRYYKKALGSADEFIDKVATKTISGYPYRVVFTDGTKIGLATWLKEQLAKHRETRAKAQTPGKGNPP